jgi:hypothetical protein
MMQNAMEVWKSVASHSSGTGRDVWTLRTDSAGNLGGYLCEKTREGRWQKRCFEANECGI